jgi:hypothetical protein
VVAGGSRDLAAWRRLPSVLEVLRVVFSAGALDAGAAALDGGSGAIFFAASGGRECWPAALAVWAPEWRRASVRRARFFVDPRCQI